MTGLTPNTTYVFTVKAYDAAGNLSTVSGSISVTTLSDPNADDDSDGVPNNIESLLGTNSSTANSTDSSNQTQLKVQRPSS